MVKANSQNKKLITVQPKKEDLQLSNIEPRSNKTESNTVISTRLDKPEPITLTNVEIKLKSQVSFPGPSSTLPTPSNTTSTKTCPDLESGHVERNE